MIRERHEREAELYVTARDGYIAGNVAIGRATARGDVTPSYVKAATASGGRPSAAAQAATLARLGALAPGSIVRRSDS